MKHCIPLIVFLICIPCLNAADKPAWVDAMKTVNKKFTGEKGTFAHFGDSITITMAFWCTLQGKIHKSSPEMDKALANVKGYMQKKCWRDWKGPQYGNNGGKTITWAVKNIDTWLKEMNPEVALIMFGTNDIRPKKINVEQYKKNYKIVVEKCLANGTIPIIQSIPPFHGREENAKAYSDAQRELAKELNVPFSDYYAESIKRRPDDWSGKHEKFSEYHADKKLRGQVPTIISVDGVHPAYPKKYRGDFSEEGLKSSGYNLRSYLTLMSYNDVLANVVQN